MSGLTSVDLLALINRTNRTEIECGKFIPQIWDKLLLGYRPIKLIKPIEQYRGNLGDCDYIIIAEVSDGARKCRKAFFWELKAPQCYIFKVDRENKNRLKPCQELIDAENQLLYYYIEHKDNLRFHRRHKLGGSRDVHLGGIIIGSNNRKMEEEVNEADREELYNEALDVRQILYDGVKMRLMTWHEIYSFIRVKETPPIEIPRPTIMKPISLQLSKAPIEIIINIEEHTPESM